MDEVRLPIAEVFCAPQGEGFKVGKLMVFVRLAGCTVGKEWDTSDQKKKFNVLNNYQKKCTLADGRIFACDTNYQLSKAMTYAELLAEVKHQGGLCKNICLTGGEPLMHANKLLSFVDNFKADNYVINLETSGTIIIHGAVNEILLEVDHVAISPKKDFNLKYLGVANEIKILVDEGLDLASFPYFDRMDKSKVFLQPVNGEHTINEDNLKLCLDLQKSYPEVRLSTQSHKSWGTR